MNKIKKCFFSEIKSKTILITGSNKGLGFQTAKSLLKNEIKSPNNQKYNFILTARNSELGLKSLKELKILANLNSQSEEKVKFTFLQLDISNEISINNCINYLKEKETEGVVDVLLNNAGVANPGMKVNLDAFDKVFTTNLFGTVDFTEKIISNNLIKKNGKIIFLSSKLGNESRLKENIRAKLQKENLTVEDILNFAKEYRKSIDNKKYFEEGWGKHLYAMSKIMIKRYADVIAKSPILNKRSIQCYSCCPGWVKTDLGGINAEKSLEEGVEIILFLLNLEDEIKKEYQGKFFEDFKVADF